MSRARHAKGILPDGRKIKKRREALGKTQKGLLQHSTVELRTYQRAEQGRPILPEILNEIAVLLETDLKELTHEKNGPAREATKTPTGFEAFRLHCVSKIGANALVTELQTPTSKVDYNFTINPTIGVAEHVASIIEYCQTLEVTRLEDHRARLLRLQARSEQSAG
jgi:transcriptional regulator with XRE-family HTH domain